MQYFTLSFVVTVLALWLSFCWGNFHGFIICLLMTAMTVSFSIDNAVVNATVLRHMNALWQKRFLTWGMLIAVFGMHYLFPVLIVSAATGLNLVEVTRLALEDPASYSHHLKASHTQIAAFGGTFLLMVFLTFMMNEDKKQHWFAHIEKELVQWGRLEAIEVIITLLALLFVQSILPEGERLHAMIAGVFGVVLYVMINSLTSMLGADKIREAAHSASSIMGFIYVNLLDASFSLDAVAGSFAISNDIVIIVLGLTAGAMFVRSMTVYMVQKGTLEQYIFLEHGAHYAIGALAIIMLVSLVAPVSEILTGMIGMVFVGLSLWSSVRYNKKDHRSGNLPER